MGNEQSVPAPPAEDSAKSQDPAIAAGDPVQDPPSDVTESANISALAIETNNVKFNDGLPTPPTTFDDLPTQAAPASSAPIGIPRQQTETRDKRPAFLRRLTTAPSAVLTAQTHAENVTATPTSPSPETALKSVAKEQLNTVSSARSGSATDPSITDKDSYFPSPDYGSETKAASPTATHPPHLGSDDKELAQSLSSFQPSERDQPERNHWDAPRSGSVSPLSCDLVSNGAQELQDQGRDGAESQMTGGIPTPPRETAFDEARPVAFSVDDWAWRMEFLPSEASDDEDDIDPEFFPLPDGDDESFADDELSFLDPGRESALRGESRNEDHSVDLALVRTASSAESTQRAASVHEIIDPSTDADDDASSQIDAMTEKKEAEVFCETEDEAAPEETEDEVRAEEPAKLSTNLEDEPLDRETVEVVESEEQGDQDKQSNVDEQSNEREETSAEVESQKEISVAQPSPGSPALDASPQPARKVIEPDSRRDSAMYQLSLESPRDMEQLQTIKEPEPADQRKRMSLASIEDIAGELSMADFDSTEAKLEPKLSQDELPTGEQPVDAATSDQKVESIVKQPEIDGLAAESQPAEGSPIEEETQESAQPEQTQIAPVAPKFEAPPKRDNLPLVDRRPATAHPSRVAAETDSRPLTAPSNPLQVSEGVPVREKSKSWRKTWPILGNRAARSKSEASHTEKGPDEILPVTPVQPRNPEPAQQAKADSSEQRKAPIADEASTPSKTPGLVSKIPAPAEQSKTKEKKKRGSILGSIFRHSSTKDEKSKSKDSAKLEKNKEKESKPSKKNSKIAKVYRRSSKRQEGGEDEVKQSLTSSSRPVTAMAILDTRMVDEPQSLEPSGANKAQANEGILKDPIGEQRAGSAGRGKYGLPSASLGIPTLLQSPAKKKQNHFPEGSWYHRKSALPQEHASSAAQLPRRSSVGIFAGPDSAEGKKVQGSHLPQARPAQPQNRRASVHVPPQVPLRANPLLPPPDDSPYARATTGIPQPSTSKIFSYPNRNPPYRGIARANSSPLQGIGAASQPQVQTPRAGPSRIPSPSLSQVPVGRRNVAPRLPGPHRAVDMRRGIASPTFSQGPVKNQNIPDSFSSREHRNTDPETPLKGAGVAISPPQPASSGVVANSGKSEQSFVAELADTGVGRRGSEEITMRATSYPGMEWVPEDME